MDIQGERPGLDSVAMTGHLQQWDWRSDDCPEWIPGALHRETEKIQPGRGNLEEVGSGKSKEDHVSGSRVKCCLKETGIVLNTHPSLKNKNSSKRYDIEDLKKNNCILKEGLYACRPHMKSNAQR